MAGISRKAAFPTISHQPLSKRLKDRRIAKAPDAGIPTDRMVAFFYGCSNNYYEPELGELAIAVLEHFDQEVILPRQMCCGLPLQSNGLLDAARRYARANISWLAPYAVRGIPIVATSTSCSLALKHDYRAILGLSGDDAEVVSFATYDIFEFFSMQLADRVMASKFATLERNALYHPPCQLRSHGIGAPAVRILSRIPGLTIHLSNAECCGVAGTYGMKQEKYSVAKEVGKHLFDQAQQLTADFILCDSETCRWWISKHTLLPVYHPLEILARALQIV
jgi:glycerol-3-phosphate dehydrogenase subunit C